MNNTDAVKALAALAQDSRLAIVRLLIQNLSLIHISEPTRPY